MFDLVHAILFTEWNYCCIMYSRWLDIMMLLGMLMYLNSCFVLLLYFDNTNSIDYLLTILLSFTFFFASMSYSQFDTYELVHQAQNLCISVSLPTNIIPN